ncbi:acyltransferase family protein [Aquabacterium sp. G14]|uniref:acyltransferase family protein n=1 Tax=Aquabacterium sp. G14 TaxID=3130164 RepID=UPI0030DBD507
MGNGCETRPKHLPKVRPAAFLVMSAHPTMVSTHLCRPSLGVDFFFVLSGFIIAHSSLRPDSLQGGAREYFKARFIRIYVPYLPIGVGIYLLYLLLPNLSQAERSPSLLTTFLLMPSDAPPALSVAWTLVHEMIFYLIFSLWFFSRKAFWSVLAIWVASILLAWFSHVTMSRFATYFLSPLNLCFILGLGISSLSKRITVSTQVGASLAAAGMLMVCTQSLNESPDRLWVALGFGLLVLAAANPSTQWAGIWQWVSAPIQI